MQNTKLLSQRPASNQHWFHNLRQVRIILDQLAYPSFEGGGGRDVFVHISAVERAGLSSLNEGQVVEYEEVSNRGKTSAENLKVQR